MSNIISSNLNILNNLVNSLSAVANRKYLTVKDPSGYGLFTFDGDMQLSGNLSSNIVYCTNNNLTDAVSAL